LQAIENLLDDITSGKYDASYDDEVAADNWLPVISDLITNVTLSKRQPYDEG